VATEPDELPHSPVAETYRKQTRKSSRSYLSAEQIIPSGTSRQTLVYEPYPFYAAKGAGAWLTDIDGNKYLDLVNNYTSLIHGHAHPPTVRAVECAVRDGSALGAPTLDESRLARMIVDRYPSMERVRFTISGSEAIGFALRAARAVTGRPRILKFEGAFHGCFDEVQHNIAASPMPPTRFALGTPNSRGLREADTVVAVFNDVASLRAAMDSYGYSVAAIISEPFLSNAGLIAADAGFLAEVRETAHRYGALFVLDDIQGMRLSYHGSQGHDGVAADLTAVGKIMSGGLPLAAFGGRSDLMELMHGFDPAIPQTGTFTAFPAALAAGCAALEGFGPVEVERLNAAGSSVRSDIRRIFARHGVPVTVSGAGSTFNIAIGRRDVRSYSDWWHLPKRSWAQLRVGLLLRGVYLTSRGTGCLSTAVTESDVAYFLNALDAEADGMG
jgi:glutamate-1-semialdehyde 2,1-aminomutase